MKTLTDTSQSDCSAALPLSGTYYILCLRKCQYKKIRKGAKRKETPVMGSRWCRRASMLLSGGTRYEVQEMNNNDQHRLTVVYPKSTVCQYLNSRKGVRSIEIKKESGSQQLTIASQSDCSAARPLSDTHCILYFRECQYKKSEQLSHGGPEGSCSCILHDKIICSQRLPRKMLRSPLKHPTGVFLYAAFNSPLWLIVKTWKSHR